MAEDWPPQTAPGPHGGQGGTAATAPEEGRMELLSHDIRSAVSDIVSGLRLIDLEALDPATAAQLQRVSTAGEALAGLLDRALKQLEGKGAVPPEDPVPLLAILRNLERRWGGHARERGMRLALNIAAGLPTVLHLDAVAVDRVLANLLSNAFKYADWGEVTLTVDMRSGEELRFTVRDRGPGFSDAALEKLFQRGGRPQGQTRPGSGLGLHIAKDLATRLGGQLQVTNDEEGGASVSLLLPHEAWAWQRDAEPGASGEPPVLPDLSGLRALVAEDNATNQLLFTQMLDHLGAEWKLAADGVEALEMLKAGDFDFALVDIDMPRLSGTEVIAATRAMKSDKRLLPMLAVTAYVLQAHRERIFAAGADGILAKPVHSLAAFGQSIASLMLRTRGEAPVPLSPVPPAAPPAPAATAPEAAPEAAAEPGYDPERLARLMEVAGTDGGREFLTRLLSDLRRTRSGLTEALDPPQPSALRGHTHVLISLSGAIGASGLQRLASRANTATHRAESGAELARMAAEIDDRLARLIADISARFAALFPDHAEDIA